MQLPHFEPNNLVYDHPDFVIINKPAGMNFHGKQTENGYILGVADWAAKALNIEKLWSVHRLDKMTSGLLIFAKSSEAAAKFSELFQNHQIQKYYLALANQKPKKKQGWIKGDMEAARRGNYKLLPTKHNPAVTQFISTSIRPKLRLFLLKPHTGRTHQLRVALKSLGSPILGDKRYQEAKQASELDRGYLHAFALEFDWNHQEISVNCPPCFGEYFVLPETQQQIHQWLPAGNCFKASK
ncbi:TIGR01621 family pseudouridine synthase [Thiomicrorhabdus indica]|uniref:TIGR01621 family pseudouridine synthase n=1 Tax=Thiomicrorhabdus indica TaxID=2267253 RepID=UPI002AA65DD2|nr:TIGR01621 family pseudouridine synthase [Thiomicrorhabdus indica]